MWFAALESYSENPWFLSLIHKLLLGKQDLLINLLLSLSVLSCICTTTHKTPPVYGKFLRIRGKNKKNHSYHSIAHTLTDCPTDRLTD